MTLIVDPPNAAGHGRHWSHLASDTSFEELHRFARQLGLSPRGFDFDHYDVPAEWYEAVVAAGASPVASRELVRRLVAAGLRRRKAETPGPRRPGGALLRPPRLRAGDTVAVVSPAGPADPDRVAAGCEVLAGWGLRVRPPARLTRGGPSWLAGTDEARAAAFTAAWLDDDVAAVWCARGGFGSQRMLELLDWSLLATAPVRLLVGFSDVTALHQAVAAALGLVTVHGPGMAGLAEVDEESRASLRWLLLEGRTEAWSVRSMVPGRAGGALVGGNLTMLASGVGTGLVRPATGGIAVLEDVNEAPYRLDRALTQLLRSGWFDGVAGIVVGELRDCGRPEVLTQLVRDRLGGLGVPLALELPVGHGPRNRALPLGMRATLDLPGGEDGSGGGGTLAVTGTLP